MGIGVLVAGGAGVDVGIGEFVGIGVDVGTGVCVGRIVGVGVGVFPELPYRAAIPDLSKSLN